MSEHTEDRFVIPDMDSLSGIYLFCKLYNDNDEFRKMTSTDASEALNDFKNGTTDAAVRKIYVTEMFKEFERGNERPLRWLSSHRGLFTERMLMFLDTETSGLTAGDKVIQLAYTVTYDGTEVYKYAEYVAWDRISIHWAAKKVHGISETKLRTHGVKPEDVFSDFDKIVNICDMIIAYNAPFDRRMMLSSHTSEQLSGATWTCCLELVRKQKYTGAFQGSSSTKLCDIYKCITKKDMVNAHDALGDVRAMMTIWDFIHKNK